MAWLRPTNSFWFPSGEPWISSLMKTWCRAAERARERLGKGKQRKAEIVKSRDGGKGEGGRRIATLVDNRYDIHTWHRTIACHVRGGSASLGPPSFLRRRRGSDTVRVVCGTFFFFFSSRLGLVFVPVLPMPTKGGTRCVLHPPPAPPLSPSPSPPNTPWRLSAY